MHGFMDKCDRKVVPLLLANRARARSALSQERRKSRFRDEDRRWPSRCVAAIMTLGGMPMLSASERNATVRRPAATSRLIHVSRPAANGVKCLFCGSRGSINASQDDHARRGAKSCRM
jgi:hypothetical protein